MQNVEYQAVKRIIFFPTLYQVYYIYTFTSITLYVIREERTFFFNKSAIKMHFFSSKICVSLKYILLLQHESAENVILLPMKDTGICFRLRIRTQLIEQDFLPQKVSDQMIILTGHSMPDKFDNDLSAWMRSKEHLKVRMNGRKSIHANRSFYLICSSYSNSMPVFNKH